MIWPWILLKPSKSLARSFRITGSGKAITSLHHRSLNRRQWPDTVPDRPAARSRALAIFRCPLSGSWQCEVDDSSSMRIYIFPSDKIVWSSGDARSVTLIALCKISDKSHALNAGPSLPEDGGVLHCASTFPSLTVQIGLVHPRR